MDVCFYRLFNNDDKLVMEEYRPILKDDFLVFDKSKILDKKEVNEDDLLEQGLIPIFHHYIYFYPSFDCYYVAIKNNNKYKTKWITIYNEGKLIKLPSKYISVFNFLYFVLSLFLYVFIIGIVLSTLFPVKIFW